MSVTGSNSSKGRTTSAGSAGTGGGARDGSPIHCRVARTACGERIVAMMRSGPAQAKVFAWYDNEWGYTNRVVDLARKMG